MAHKKVLVLGDITGTEGKKIVVESLPKIIKRYGIHFVIANAENVDVSRRGITKNDADELYNAGVDVITLGNHAFSHSGIYQIIDRQRLLRPVNMICLPGNGSVVVQKDGVAYCVISALGSVDMPISTNHAFPMIKKLLRKFHDLNMPKGIFIDFHAEVALEKYCLAYHLNGQITALYGTHTHIPTADLIILSKGTGYQTDVGMCGNYGFMYGKNPSPIMSRYIYWKSDVNYTQKKEQKRESAMCGTIITFDPETGKTVGLKQLIHSSYLHSANTDNLN